MKLKIDDVRSRFIKHFDGALETFMLHRDVLILSANIQITTTVSYFREPLSRELSQKSNLTNPVRFALIPLT